MSIIDEYRKKIGASESLYRRAVNVLPGGVAHDIRILPPFPLYVERAAGSRKWDVEGNEYIDFWMAHGGLMLGHNPPQGRSAPRFARSSRDNLHRVSPGSRLHIIMFSSSGHTGA